MTAQRNFPSFKTKEKKEKFNKEEERSHLVAS